MISYRVKTIQERISNLTTQELVDLYNKYLQPRVPLTIEEVKDDYLDENCLGYFTMYQLPSYLYEERQKKIEKKQLDNQKKKDTNYIICWERKDKIGESNNYKLIRTCKQRQVNSNEYNHLETLLDNNKFSDYQIVAVGRNMHIVDMIYLDFDVNANQYLKSTYDFIVRNIGLNINGYIISRPRSKVPHMQFFINLNRPLDLNNEDDKLLFDFIMTTFRRAFDVVGIDHDFKGLQARNPGCEIDQKVNIFTTEKMSLNNLLATLYDWNIDNYIAMPERVHELINGHPLTKPCTLDEFSDVNKSILRKKSNKNAYNLSYNSLNYKKLKNHPYLNDLLSYEEEIKNYYGNMCSDIINRLHFYCNDYGKDSRNTSGHFNTKYFLRDLEIDNYTTDFKLSELTFCYYETYALPFTSKKSIETPKEMKASVKGTLDRAKKESKEWQGDKSLYTLSRGKSKFTDEQRKRGQDRQKFDSDLRKIKIKYRKEIEKETWSSLSKNYSKGVIKRALDTEIYNLVKDIISYLEKALNTYLHTKDVALKIYLFDNIIAVAMSLSSMISALIGYTPKIFKEIEDILCNTNNSVDVSKEVQEEIVGILNVSMPIFNTFIETLYNTGEIINIDGLIQSKTGQKHVLKRLDYEDVKLYG